MKLLIVSNNTTKDKIISDCTSQSVPFIDITQIGKDKITEYLKAYKAYETFGLVLYMTKSKKEANEIIVVVSKSGVKYSYYNKGLDLMKNLMNMDEKVSENVQWWSSLKTRTYTWLDWRAEVDIAEMYLKNSRADERRHWKQVIDEISDIILDRNYGRVTSDQTEVLINQKIEDYSNQKRFNVKRHGLQIIDYGLGEIWNEAFNFYLSTIPKNVSIELLACLNDTLFNKAYTQSAVVDILKLIGDHAKQYGEIFSDNWKYYVNMDSLWKFGSYYDELDQLRDILEWFNPETVADYRSGLFYSLFKKNMKLYFQRNWQQRPREYMSFRHWLALGLWGTTGATDMPSPQLQINDKLIPTEKSKNGSVLLMKLDELENILYDENPQVNKISVKPDEAPNKTRLIASSDNKNYLLMSYISTIIFDNMSSKVSTLYKTSDQMTSFWLDMMTGVDRATIKIPIDQKGFDHKVRGKMIEIFLEEIESVVPDIFDFKQAAYRLKLNLLNNKSYWIYRDKTILVSGLIRGGVPSGWRWTADIDTCISEVEQKTMIDLQRILGGKIDVWSETFQGDDVQMEVLDKKSVPQLMATYTMTGFNINKGKFFVSEIRNEFLRKVQVKGQGMFGYPARTVHALLWRSPGKIDREKNSVGSIMDNWFLYIRRIANPIVNKKIINIAISDVSRAFKISKQYIKDWMFTPKSLGGFGLVNDSNDNLWVSIVTILKPRKYQFTGNLAGLKEIAAVSGVELSDTESNKILNSVVKPRDKNDVEVSRQVTVLNKLTYVPLKPNTGLLLDSKPRWLKTVPIILRQTIVDRIKKRNDVLSILDKLEDSSKSALLRLKSNASMAVIKEWLIAGFDYKVYTSERLASDFLSGANTDKELVMKRAMGLRKLTLATLKRVQLYTEIITRRNNTLNLKILATGNDPSGVYVTG